VLTKERTFDMVVKEKDFYVRGFLSISAQTEIIIKAQRFGYDASFCEYGAGTFVTFVKGEM